MQAWNLMLCSTLGAIFCFAINDLSAWFVYANSVVAVLTGYAWMTVVSPTTFINYSWASITNSPAAQLVFYSSSLCAWNPIFSSVVFCSSLHTLFKSLCFRARNASIIYHYIIGKSAINVHCSNSSQNYFKTIQIIGLLYQWFLTRTMYLVQKFVK